MRHLTWCVVMFWVDFVRQERDENYWRLLGPRR